MFMGSTPIFEHLNKFHFTLLTSSGVRFPFKQFFGFDSHFFNICMVSIYTFNRFLGSIPILEHWPGFDSLF